MNFWRPKRLCTSKRPEGAPSTTATVSVRVLAGIGREKIEHARSGSEQEGAKNQRRRRCEEELDRARVRGLKSFQPIIKKALIAFPKTL